MEKVLVLNGSFCELPIIEECHRQGFYVITCGNMPELMGHQYADEYVCADYSDYTRILEIVRERDIHHVLSCANDFGSITAAYVDEQMGWHHHDTFENATLLHHKDLFKSYIQSKGYPTPISKFFDSEWEAISYVNKNPSFPLIVKANDLTGGKGILKAENTKEAVAAINNAFSRSRSKHILIEPFVTGDQQTFVTFLHDEKVIATSSCDSYSYVNPYLIQAETLPAKNIEDVQHQLVSIIEEMASDLHLSDGIFAYQYIRKGKDFQIIEMMRRPFGNQFLKLVELNSGFPWHQAQVTAETGGDWSFLKGYDNRSTAPIYCGHYGIMSDHNGKLVGYNIPATIRKHIIKEFVMKNSGDMITDYMNERISFLHFQYGDYAEMCDEVSTYNREIVVEVE